jgi:hypothetical protein
MNEFPLRDHRLAHIRDLKVEPAVFTARFARACSMSRCTGRCCEDGVWTDAAEHEAILRNAALIQAQMDHSQERNPERWFDPEPRIDSDFPSGHAIGTAVANGACVFLGADRRCVLQKASTGEVGNLKPFFCITFPLTINEGTLCLDDPRDAACCTPSTDAPLTVFDLCAHELEHMLGVTGVKELQALARGVVK